MLLLENKREVKTDQGEKNTELCPELISTPSPKQNPIHLKPFQEHC